MSLRKALAVFAAMVLLGCLWWLLIHPLIPIMIIVIGTTLVRHRWIGPRLRRRLRRK